MPDLSPLYALIVHLLPFECMQARFMQQAMAGLLKDVNAQLVGHEKLHMLVVAKEPWSKSPASCPTPITATANRCGSA